MESGRDRQPILLVDEIGHGDGIEGIGHGDYFVFHYFGRIFYFSPREYLYTPLDQGKKHPKAGFEYIAGKKLLVVPTNKNNTVAGL